MSHHYKDEVKHLKVYTDNKVRWKTCIKKKKKEKLETVVVSRIQIKENPITPYGSGNVLQS